MMKRKIKKKEGIEPFQEVTEEEEQERKKEKVEDEKEDEDEEHWRKNWNIKEDNEYEKE